MTEDLLHIPDFLRRAPDDAAMRRAQAPRKIVYRKAWRRKRKTSTEISVLQDLGYTPSEISSIKPPEAQRIWRTTTLAQEWRRRRAEVKEKQERKRL